ncbi:MAG: amino acid adenylation domain-containing protein [Pseudomonadota bacterium]
MFLRSGDLGFLQNDELYITGRLKDLMIFAGRNYYPHDVELTIERIDPRFQLGSCAAFSVEIDGVEELIAIQEIPRRGRHDLDLETVAGKIRRAVAEEHELHIHAVVFLFRGQIPKTSSGKIKRHACQRAFLEGTFEEFGRSTLSGGNLAQDALMAPSSADLKSCSIGQRDTLVTDHLCSLLKSALRRQISEADLLRPLVQLGLDSINATLITHRIESDLGVELSAIDLLSGASTQELASKIANDLSFTSSPATQSKAPSQCSEASLEQRDPELLPLNAGQEALWYMHQLSPQSSSLNEMFAARVTSTLDVEVLQRSFQLLVDRHSALRTTITLSEGMPWQLVHEEQCVDFQVVNALEWTAEQVDAFIAKEGHKSFDLKTGPLFRVLVCSLADNNHVLLLSAHHIVVDFWSLLLILDELRTIYPVIRTGGNMRLPLIVGQLSNHAVQQHDFMATTAAQTKLTYWQSKLSGSQPILNLTADQPRPVVNNFRGSRSSFTWDGEFSKKVKSAAAQRCCTPYTFMLTAFFVLLHRYTGKLDITVGSSSTGRLSAEFAKSVGYFVNQVALRVQLSHNATFSSWLDEVWKSVLEAQANQEIPHSRLVAHLSPGRTSSSPLFNTMFVHEQCHQLPELAPLFSGIAGRGVYLGELRFESFAIERRASQFDLSLMVLDQPHGMSLTWEYNTELFSSNRVAQIHRHFENILRTAVDNVEQPVGCLAMLDDSELTKITSDWNKTHSPNSSDKCFHELFELQALSHPDVIALETGTESLTFRALNEQANQVARYLRTVGVGQNSLVAVCMKRSIEMMAALIGVLKTGAAYVPIDPNYPPERKAILIEDSHPHAVLSQRSVADSLPRIAPRVICLDVAVKEIGMHDKSDLRIPLRTDSLAYVIYTSGSTGRPKGVAVPHRGLMNYLNWCVDAYGASLGSGAAVSTSIGFDATITSLFSPLLVGRKVVLLPEERELFALYQALQEEFSLVKLTPSHLEILRSLLVAEQAKDAHGRFPTIRVRVMVIGGEALSAKSVAFWRNVAPATRLINEYGPTEAVVGCCFYEVPDELPSDGCVPIGRPITNAKVYILDTQFQPVPVGVQGELYIGGDGLADGYYNQPDLTAERFLRLPLCDNCLTRVYKTGDAACYLPDGTIEFLGRLDDQVQIRGFRIELGEVESALRRHPRIEEAAVVVTGETDDDQRLIAYIVCVTDENEVRPIELQHFLSPILPNQAVPTAFVTIDHLPLTSHGKVDRDALPAPQSEHFCKTQHRIQPQGNLEKLVAEAWKDVLNRDDVGVEDNFFDAGGHSLLAVRLSERLHSLCESISVIDILQHPTIRLLAKHLAGQKPSLGSISITSRANVQIEVIRRFQTKHRQRDGQN